jgi:hypothetical protein
LVAKKTSHAYSQFIGCAKSHSTSKLSAAEGLQYVHRILDTLTPSSDLTLPRRVQGKASHFPNQRRPSAFFSTRCTIHTTPQPAPSSRALRSGPRSKRNAQWRSYSTSSSHLTRSLTQSYHSIRKNTNMTSSTTSRN